MDSPYSVAVMVCIHNGTATFYLWPPLPPPLCKKFYLNSTFFLQGFPLRGRLQIAPSSKPNTLDTSDKKVDLRRLKFETPQFVEKTSFYKAVIQDGTFRKPVEFNLGRGHVGPGGGNSRGSAGTHLKRSCITNVLQSFGIHCTCCTLHSAQTFDLLIWNLGFL